MTLFVFLPQSSLSNAKWENRFGFRFRLRGALARHGVICSCKGFTRNHFTSVQLRRSHCQVREAFIIQSILQGKGFTSFDVVRLSYSPHIPVLTRTLVANRSSCYVVFIVVVYLLLQVLVALACDLGLDSRLNVADKQWSWLKQYCLAFRVAYSVYNRKPFPTQFLEEVGTLLRQSFHCTCTLYTVPSCFYRYSCVFSYHFPCVYRWDRKYAR